MARIRTIKPDFWVSGKQLRLSADAVILIISLWNNADDEGRMVDDPVEIGAHCPRVSGKVEQLLNELDRAPFIHRYVSENGRKYIQVHDWKDHQVINHPKPSTIPKMRKTDVLCYGNDTGMFPERSRNATVALPGEVEVEGKEVERKGRNYCSEVPESAPSAPPAEDKVILTFPTNGTVKTWNLTASKLAEYATSYPAVDVLAACRHARQWCEDVPKRRKTASGMGRFLTNWLGKEQNRPRITQGIGRRPEPPTPDFYRSDN